MRGNYFPGGVFSSPKPGPFFTEWPDTSQTSPDRIYLRNVKHPKGRPAHTWVEQMRKDLLKINIKLDQMCTRNTTDQLCELTKDRDRYGVP